jgi:ATP-binding cassette subfamily C protein
MDVATIAGIDAFIKSGLADGYDTVVGDGRISVSGGQKQRIGIARSLYHKPSVLILDEATNELDKETEVGILDALLRIEGLTIIFVSHKSSVQEKSDVVISLFGIGQQTEEINSA